MTDPFERPGKSSSSCRYPSYLAHVLMSFESPIHSDSLWYKDAVFYEIYVRGFYDSNADGIGDFRGLTEKLDYLKWLGVDCLWLLPMYASPLRDGGYDISDYYSILPEYGALDDFKNFLDAAHARGLRVIIDLVLNHTSDEHPWFRDSRSSTNSPKRDWYVWSETDLKYAGARIIFLDTERSNWAWDEQSGQFYWHRFFSHQPDLNYDNPEVQDAVLEVISFWLDMGVDGFRLDAVPYLFEREGTNCENLPETHAFIKRLRRFVDERYPGRLLLAEANQWPEDVVEYFGQGDECHMCYHFPIMPRLFMALRQEDRLPIVEILNRTPAIPATAQWGMFLRNHDELTLEMVTDEERDYLYAEYAKERRMRINLGIRRRLAPLMDNGRRRIELLNALLFSLPGSPFLYYGDEIGMGDNIYMGDRDGVRTPMQWSLDRNAGFSRADFAQLYFPINMDPVYGYQSVNVEAQQRHATSLLHWMRAMITLRKKHSVFGRGALEILHPENRKILAFTRSYEDESVLCIYNLARSSQPLLLDLSQYEGMTPIDLQYQTRFPRINARPYQLALNEYGFYWLLLAWGEKSEGAESR
jgi:maltose alpha-D-glucosyltransferase / alpha-amylase